MLFYICWGLLFTFLIIAPLLANQKLDKHQEFLINIFFVLSLVLIITFRTPGADADYMNYVSTYQSRYAYRDTEYSYQLIKIIGQNLKFPVIFFFFIYAALSAPVKFFAIKRYSYCPIYSICVWLSFSFILHDLIQIRASIATGLMLWFLPLVVDKKYVKSILVLSIALFFHYSAILMAIVYFIKSDRINKVFWIAVYALSWLINLKIVNPYSIITMFWDYLPTFITDRTADTNGVLDRLADLHQINIYAAYLLLPAIITIIALFNAHKIYERYHYGIALIKVMFIAEFIFSLGLPIISVRGFEFLSVTLIYLVPLMFLCLNGKFKKIAAEIIITCFCLLTAYNLLIKQEVIAIL